MHRAAVAVPTDGTAPAGGMGIVLFWVQHIFENTYASDELDWGYHATAIRGSAMPLPNF